MYVYTQDARVVSKLIRPHKQSSKFLWERVCKKLFEYAIAPLQSSLLI
jgi:hypothetical protein